MLTTLVTASAMFIVMLITHNYVLEAIHKDAADESKSEHKATD
jgi:hypothetical protein